MEIGYKEVIVILGVLLLLLPIFFERIYDDEAIYWKLSNSISEEGISRVASLNRMPLAFLIVSPLLLINDSIFVPRVISAILAIASALLIFEIVKLHSKEEAAFISSMLFIFSFQTIRFGTRFYLDIYGVFFFLLTIYFIKKNRIRLAGLSFAFAILSRELWLGLYPFMLLYVWRDRKPARQFFLLSIIPLILFLAYLQLTSGIGTYLSNSGFSQVSSIPDDLPDIPRYLFQSWGEFFVIHFLTVVGFILWVMYERDGFLLLILPQFLLVSLVQGFILNGALTQYAMGLQASMALTAGPGIWAIWKKYMKGHSLKTWFLGALLLQFFLFSYLATVLSLRGALGMHDFGYWYDEKVISLLNREANNETIAGFHGAFIKNAGEWIWWERGVSYIVKREPDWYVVVEPQLITFKAQPQDIKEVELYKVGPYIVFHSNPRGHLNELIEPNKNFSKWVLRSV